jgi:UDP-glucose 4-epimerase
MKRILITGANSYIGESVRDYLLQQPDKYEVDIVDTIGFEPTADAFAKYEVVFNVAGIAHIKETPDNRHLYYDVNRDLCIKMAKAAKKGGVKQFILLSTMSVYGKVVGHITKETKEAPVNSYGKSKLQADEYIKKLADDSFKFACVRPPMVYGKGCKGNYQSLRKFALKSPVFPYYKNERSMIFIGNLCEFIKNLIDEEKSGLFFPQNKEYVNTSKLVNMIAINNGEKVKFVRCFNPMINVMNVGVVNKVFGDLTYEKTDVVDKYSFEESVSLTENDISVT